MGDGLMHKIDLEKYEIRTDMAIDLTEKDKDTYKPKTYNKKSVKVSWIELDKIIALVKNQVII